MQTILVPVDGSESARRAVAWLATAYAPPREARVHLLHVQPVVDGWEVRSHLGADDIARLQAASAAAILDPARATLTGAGLTVETHALSGDIAPTIAQAVRQFGCDAVVMGTRGLGPVQTLLLGSTTLKVIHLVDVPVTLIK